MCCFLSLFKFLSWNWILQCSLGFSIIKSILNFDLKPQPSPPPKKKKIKKRKKTSWCMAYFRREFHPGSLFFCSLQLKTNLICIIFYSSFIIIIMDVHVPCVLHEHGNKTAINWSLTSNWYSYVEYWKVGINTTRIVLLGIWLVLLGL